NRAPSTPLPTRAPQGVVLQYVPLGLMTPRTWKRRLFVTPRRCVRCPRRYRRWNILIASRCTSSVPTVVSVGNMTLDRLRRRSAKPSLLPSDVPLTLWLLLEITTLVSGFQGPYGFHLSQGDLQNFQPDRK